MKYENVKIGDEFLLSSRMSERLCKVTKVTPKRFECGGFVFNKENGHQVGATMYSNVHISTVTDEQKQVRINEVKKRQLVKKLSEVSYRTFSLEQLKSIENFITSINP